MCFKSELWLGLHLLSIHLISEVKQKWATLVLGWVTVCTSEVIGSNPGPYVVKLVVAYRWSAVYSTEP